MKSVAFNACQVILNTNSTSLHGEPQTSAQHEYKVAFSQRAVHLTSHCRLPIEPDSADMPSRLFIHLSHMVCINSKKFRRSEKPHAPFRITHLFNHSLIHSTQIFIKPLHAQDTMLGSGHPLFTDLQFYNLFSLFEVPSRTQFLSRVAGLVSIGNCSVAQQTK